MSGRPARIVATAAWLMVLGLAIAEAWMIVATLDRPATDQWGFRGFEAALSVSFGSVGALIAARCRDNGVGWLMLGLSLVMAAEGIIDQYPVLAEAASPQLPYGGLAHWVAIWIWVIPATGFASFLPLIFPNGRLLSPRWRQAVLLAFVAMAVLVGSIILATQPLGPIPPTTNVPRYFEELGLWMVPGYGLYLASTAVAGVSIVVRYRRAAGEERQQIKWFAYAAALFVPGAALGLAPFVLGQVVFVTVGLLGAAAIGMAILRYRLYEIDVIINRTIVYGALSAILAGVYTASITLSQRVFTAVTGERSDAAIVLTTLIVASTFTPLKLRVQAIVDRRAKSAAPDAEVEALLEAAEDRFRQIAREEVAAIAPRARAGHL